MFLEPFLQLTAHMAEVAKGAIASECLSRHHQTVSPYVSSFELAQ